MHSFRVVGKNVAAEPALTFSMILVKKCVIPIHDFRVSKACSTVCRRMSMAHVNLRALGPLFRETMDHDAVTDSGPYVVDRSAQKLDHSADWPSA